jgi:F420-non-reducing hydrogenase iron-sulfur subunit
MTQKRMLFLQDFLSFVGLGGRLRLEWISSAEANKFVQVVTEFTEQIRRLGPSPLRTGQEALAALHLPPVSEAAGRAACPCGHAPQVVV